MVDEPLGSRELRFAKLRVVSAAAVQKWHAFSCVLIKNVDVMLLLFLQALHIDAKILVPPCPPVCEKLLNATSYRACAC